MYHAHKGRIIRKVNERAGGGGGKEVQKQKKVHARHKLKTKFLHCKGTRKKYPARITDEIVYTITQFVKKHACGRKFPPLLPPTTLPVISNKSPPKVPPGISFYFFSSDYQVVSLATG